MLTKNKLLHIIAETLKTGHGLPITDFDYQIGHNPHLENVIDEEGGIDYLILSSNQFKIEMTLCMSLHQTDGSFSFNIKGTGMDENYTLYLSYDNSIMQQTIDIIVHHIDFWS